MRRRHGSNIAVIKQRQELSHAFGARVTCWLWRKQPKTPAPDTRRRGSCRAGPLRFSPSTGRRELAHPCAQTVAPCSRARLRGSARFTAPMSLSTAHPCATTLLLGSILRPQCTFGGSESGGLRNGVIAGQHTRKWGCATFATSFAFFASLSDPMRFMLFPWSRGPGPPHPRNNTRGSRPAVHTHRSRSMRCADSSAVNWRWRAQKAA